MDLLNYSKDHNAFRARLADFMAREVTPRVPEFEENHLVPRAVWKRMGEQGFLCTGVPEDYGGQGLDFLYSVIVVEELSRTFSHGFQASLHSDIIVPYITSFGSEEQKKKFLPGCVSGDIVTAVAMTEPDAGSDLASIRTTAEQTGDEVKINGAKIFISNGVNCGLVILVARDPGVENPYDALSLYLVPEGAPGFNKGRNLEKMGFVGQDTAELFFTNCRIPVANRLGRKGAGFKMLMQKLQQERLICAIMALASAERVVEWVTGHCKTSTEGGRPLSRQQAVSFALVEMAADTRVSRAFVEKLVCDHMEGKSVVVETSMAKYWCTRMASRIADRGLDLIGGEAYKNNNPIARSWRDLRILQILAGTNEIMKTVAARFMGL